MKKIFPAEESLYRKSIDMGRKMGLKTLVSKINTIIFMEPNQLSLEEISKISGYSLASVSNTIKHLEMMKKVRKIKRPGSKKVFVEGEKDVVFSMHQHFKLAIDNVLRPMEEIIPYTVAELKKEFKKKSLSKSDKEKIKEKISWYEDYHKQNIIINNIFKKMESEFRKYEHR